MLYGSDKVIFSRLVTKIQQAAEHVPYFPMRIDTLCGCAITNILISTWGLKI